MMPEVNYSAGTIELVSASGATWFRDDFPLGSAYASDVTSST